MRGREYKRIHSDAAREARRLFVDGYRQTSSRYRMVANIEVPDVTKALCKALRTSQPKDWPRWSQDDHWRRCYSRDVLNNVDEDVMKELGKLGTTAPLVPLVSDALLECVDNSGAEEMLNVGFWYKFRQSPGKGLCLIEVNGAFHECLRSKFKFVF